MKETIEWLRSGLAVTGILLCFIASGEVAMAQLPPVIMADRYLVQAERELAGGDPGAAVETLNRIVALQAEHGLEIPDQFWFRRAQAAHDAGLHELAIESVVLYLENTGQGGEHYRAALELYDAAELAKAEAVAALAAEMVVIPAGSFRMGCVSGLDCDDDEFPGHVVTIPQAFAVSKYEVTFAEWDACVLDGGCGGYRPDDEGWGRGTRPVINVSWEDAQSYVSWLSSRTGERYRLLTEAEWEYVARAGSSTAYSWGDGIGPNRANCEGCASQWDDRKTAPVGSFSANAFGVHDMHGNVWEWVEDCLYGSHEGAPTEGSAWRSGGCALRVLRGGSWSYIPRSLRSPDRDWDATGNRLYDRGFRMARTLTP